MKKFYKTFLLIITLIFLSTFNPKKLETDLKNNNSYFKIQKIIIINNSLVEKEDVLAKLNYLYGKNIFLIQSKDIRESLQNVDFLKKIEVKKKYPKTITIKIFETKPIGIVFKDKKQYLLDSSLNLIKVDEKDNFSELPNIVGSDSENNIVNFLNQLENNKFPIHKIKNFHYFKIGRWDVEFKDGRIIKFPYKVNDKVIEKTIKLFKRKDFENYKIIDLRIDGKIIVE